MASGKAMYSIAVVVFGFICFVVGAIAVGLPTWGYYYSFENPNYDKGYFGPWRICKSLLYNREKCGSDVSKFRPSTAVYIAGVVGVIGTAVLGVFCVLSVLQLAMISSKERVGLKYSHLVMIKLALALLAALLSIAAAGLFAVQSDDRGFHVTRGEAFYVQIVCIVINSLLFIMSVYDALFTRRSGGDPTGRADAATIPNPGFKEGRGISMTDASGKPYSTNGHGSVASMNTTATTLTGASDVSLTRSPLRSSLKKPRHVEPGLGIPNPGYSGHSPPLNRNGSQKKVRIQTHSTESESMLLIPPRSPLRCSLKKPRHVEPGLGIPNPGYSGHSPPLNRNGSQKKVRIQTHSTESESMLLIPPRSPLRCSLKKPRHVEPGLGIPNPGYSGHSPPLNRNGSQKKVRIQTHSTEV